MLSQSWVLASFKNFITENHSLLDQKIIKNALELINSELTINGSTMVTNQDYLVYTIYSTLEINGLELLDSNITSSMFYVAESEANINNMTINGIN